MLEVLHFGPAFLQIEMEICLGLMVSLMLRNTGRYLFIMKYHQGGTFSAGGQRPLTHDQRHYAQRRDGTALQSSDLNIMESVWDNTDRRKVLRKFQSTIDLWLVPKDVQNSVTTCTLENLCWFGSKGRSHHLFLKKCLKFFQVGLLYDLFN